MAADETQRRAPAERAVVALVWLVLATAATPSVVAQETGSSQDTFLEEVAPLLLDEEREAFLALDRPYQREAFIRRFWEVRDPFPETGRNEFQASWSARLAEARLRFESLDSDRARSLLLYGLPARVELLTCPELLSTLEIWYFDGHERFTSSFTLIFERSGGGGDPYRRWSPVVGIGRLMPFARPSQQTDALRQVAETCPRGGDLVAALSIALDWERVEEETDLVPRPSPEWVAAFRARSTDLPTDAATFPATVRIDYPGRRQSRTVVQGVVTVPLTAAAVGVVGGREAYSFLLDGEVLRKGELFEHFRYRFDLPTAEMRGEAVPLVLERHLRPGDYKLVLRVEDLNSEAYFRRELDLSVPRVRPGPPPLPTAGAGAPAPADPEPAVPAASDAAIAVTRRLGEANAELGSESSHTVRILPPPRELHTGPLRVEALASGPEIARVGFLLDGKATLSKTRPPFSVELDLGRSPRTHTLAAVAEDAEGRELARDEILINAGAQSFSVRLLEPRPGKRYEESLRARADVDLPPGAGLDRLEIYLNETLLATLYQPPWTQVVLLPPNPELLYVRAVAYLEDGASAEDVAIVNAPDWIDEMRIDLVELYVSALDRKGRPVEDLTVSDFTVLEDGESQELRRFERVRDLPVHATVLLDVSTSMAKELVDAERAALRFFEQVLTPSDRASVITFSDQPRLVVPFTNSLGVLAGGLSGLLAEGETALHDSVIFALYRFGGVRGKKALILLSDGEDSHSSYSFEEALEYARYAGVAIYAIGLDINPRAVTARSTLQRLASETGGESFFISRVNELEKIYERIQEEIRSQYLLAYQSSAEGEGFREVEVRISRREAEAKTVKGYYP